MGYRGTHGDGDGGAPAGKKPNTGAKVRILSHTHWDREWYLPSRYTAEWLGPFFGALLDRLEEDPAYRFSLDGQTILIEDFLEMETRGALRPPLAKRSSPPAAESPAGESPAGEPPAARFPVARRSPEKLRSALAGYAREGRLTVGPYYQQPDWNLAGGEALIRNLLIGLGDVDALCEGGAGESPAHTAGGPVSGTPATALQPAASPAVASRQNTFGPPGSPAPASPVGWLPDNFGQTAQTVQIHRLFGISELVTWRGIGLPPEDIATELLWRAPDGSEALTVYLVDSYRNAMQLLADPDKLSARIRWAVDRLRPFALTPLMLLLNGYDQEVDPEPVPTALRTYPVEIDDIRQVTLSEYVGELYSSQSFATPLPTIEGAQYDGRYIAVFPGVLSARTYLKISNRRCETLLARVLEPIASAAWRANGWYPSAELDELWRTLLRNHPHDSLCGVSVDPVHVDMELRFAEISARAFDLIERCSAQRRCEPALFNPSPWTRRTVVHEDRRQRLIECAPLAYTPIDRSTSGLADDAPEPAPCAADSTPGEPEPAPCVGDSTPRAPGPTPCAADSTPGAPGPARDAAGSPGGAFDTLAGGEGPESEVEPLTFDPQSWRVRSATYVAELERDGTLTLTDRSSGRRYSGLATLVDGGDAGDTYNYSAPSHDRIVRSTGAAVQRCAETIGPYECVLEARLNLHVPSELCRDRTGRAERTTGLPITVRFRFQAHSPLVGITVSVENRARDHRLRLYFPTDLSSGEYRRETQYYIERTPIDIPAGNRDEELPPHVSRVMLGAREREPIRQFPQNRFSFIRDDDGNTLAVFNRGLPEVEAIPERSTLAITLLRSIGWLARPDLSSRIGDAGPMIYTPDAYCLRRTVFDLAIVAGSFDDAEIVRNAEEFATPIERIDAAPVDDAGSIVSIDNPLMCLSALKRSESGNALVLRLWNSCDRRTAARLRFGFPVADARVTAADETGADLRAGPDQRAGADKRTGGVNQRASADQRAGTGAISIARCGRSDFSVEANGWTIVTLVIEPAESPAEDGGESFSADRRAPISPTDLDAGGRIHDLPPLDETDVGAEYERWLHLARERDSAGEAVERHRRETSGASDDRNHRNRGARADWSDYGGTGLSDDDPRLAELRSHYSTLVRAALEAELSWVLNREKLRQWEAGEVLPADEDTAAREEIRRIGNELNHARIAKRLDDYLLSMARESE